MTPHPYQQFFKPRNARHIMTCYRKFILGTKHKHNLDLISQGKDPSKRAARSLIYYKAYVAAYLKAKIAVINGEELVDA